MFTLSLLFVYLLLLLAIQAALTHGTACLVGASQATWKRAAAIVTLVTAWSLLWIPVVQRFETFDEDAVYTTAIPLLGLYLITIFLIYRRAYRLNLKQLLAFVVMQTVLVVCSYAVALPTKWYVFEAFKIPTNSMAPNVRGQRIETTCRSCGGLVVSTVDDAPSSWGTPSDPGACTRCGKEAKPIDIHGKVHAGDRLIVAKWYEPRRWDAVVFRYPRDPAANYLKRIVGMPGEEIVIDEDGRLIVGGSRLEPPPGFSELHYTIFSDEPESRALDGEPLWGDRRRPMKLADDEYFVLGDHTYRALDSRFWGPVKREAIVGAATLLYWPPSRWRIFR